MSSTTVTTTVTTTGATTGATTGSTGSTGSTTPVSVRDLAVAAAGTATAGRRLWAIGLAAGAVAAAATMLTAAIARGLGVDLAVGGEPIPVAGFATLTLVGALCGIVIARLARRSRHPRATFARVTVALTIASMIPDVVADAGWDTRLVLAATHALAAAIIVPVLARRLAA